MPDINQYLASLAGFSPYKPGRRAQRPAGWRTLLDKKVNDNFYKSIA